MYICDVHDNIECNLNNALGKINDIIRQINHMYDLLDLAEIVDEIDDLRFIIKENLDDIKIAKNMGEDMENRLIEYCNAIEDLGFKRTK